jgi:uncharacterized protein (DUF433 family)
MPLSPPDLLAEIEAAAAEERAGSTRDQILAAYPYLEPEDIDEALQYAALLTEDETIELAW